MWTQLKASVAEHVGGATFVGHGAAFTAQAYAHTTHEGIVLQVHGGGIATDSTAGVPDLSTLDASPLAAC